MTKNYLANHLFNTDSSSESNNSSIFRPNDEDNDTESDIEDDEVSFGVSENVIDRCIIVSTTSGKEKEKKDDTNGAKCTMSETPSASVVSNLTFYSDTRSRLHSRESSSES